MDFYHVHTVNDQLKIRPYQSTDETTVIQLWHQCGLVVSWNDPRKDILRKQQVQPELFLIAEANGEIIATVMVGYEGHRGWLNYLAVALNIEGKELVNTW